MLLSTKVGVLFKHRKLYLGRLFRQPQSEKFAVLRTLAAKNDHQFRIVACLCGFSAISFIAHAHYTMQKCVTYYVVEKEKVSAVPLYSLQTAREAPPLSLSRLLVLVHIYSRARRLLCCFYPVEPAFVLKALPARATTRRHRESRYTLHSREHKTSTPKKKKLLFCSGSPVGSKANF
jgi:hypothetical protein